MALPCRAHGPAPVTVRVQPQAAAVTRLASEERLAIAVALLRRRKDEAVERGGVGPRRARYLPREPRIPRGHRTRRQPRLAAAVIAPTRTRADIDTHLVILIIGMLARTPKYKMTSTPRCTSMPNLGSCRAGS